jgi:hypothetical protein
MLTPKGANAGAATPPPPGIQPPPIQSQGGQPVQEANNNPADDLPF